MFPTVSSCHLLFPTKGIEANLSYCFSYNTSGLGNWSFYKWSVSPLLVIRLLFSHIPLIFVIHSTCLPTTTFLVLAFNLFETNFLLWNQYLCWIRFILFLVAFVTLYNLSYNQIGKIKCMGDYMVMYIVVFTLVIFAHIFEKSNSKFDQFFARCHQLLSSFPCWVNHLKTHQLRGVWYTNRKNIVYPNKILKIEL